MIEPDFGACEVRFLLPDIRLERSECTARTWVPSLLHIWEMRNSDLRIRQEADFSRTYLVINHAGVRSTPISDVLRR